MIGIMSILQQKNKQNIDDMWWQHIACSTVLYYVQCG